MANIVDDSGAIDTIKLVSAPIVVASEEASVALFWIAGLVMFIAAFFCFAEGVIGVHIKAGTSVGAGIAERMLVSKAEKDRLTQKINSELINPSNREERRWFRRAAICAIIGILLLVSPIVFSVVSN